VVPRHDPANDAALTAADNQGDQDRPDLLAVRLRLAAVGAVYKNCTDSRSKPPETSRAY
jgi:hypothetical protein